MIHDLNINKAIVKKSTSQLFRLNLAQNVYVIFDKPDPKLKIPKTIGGQMRPCHQRFAARGSLRLREWARCLRRLRGLLVLNLGAKVFHEN